MDTGFQDYAEYTYTAPATALTKAQKHLTALRTAVNAAVADGSTSYDSRALESEIERTSEDIRQLAATAGMHGRVRITPCVTAEGAGVSPYSAPGMVR